MKSDMEPQVLSQVFYGNCREVLATLPSASVDCVITDPPYAEISRDYGRMTEQAWMEMMQEIVPEIRRVLKPHGSAAFILQPNYERIGKLRLWLWKFMLWVGEEWNVIQDAYWWNIAALPMAGATNAGLMRSSVKPIIWAGPADCYRNQEAVLWEPSDAVKLERTTVRAGRHYSPSGISVDHSKIKKAAARRGGVTPYNVLPFPNANSHNSAGAFGHGAGTPYLLADWWVRYICPPGGVVLDPFAGTGTMGLAAAANGARFIGIEKERKYAQVAAERLGLDTYQVATRRLDDTYKAAA